jgi:hypothetical protein
MTAAARALRPRPLSLPGPARPHATRPLSRPTTRRRQRRTHERGLGDRVGGAKPAADRPECFQMWVVTSAPPAAARARHQRPGAEQAGAAAAPARVQAPPCDTWHQPKTDCPRRPDAGRPCGAEWLHRGPAVVWTPSLCSCRRVLSTLASGPGVGRRALGRAPTTPRVLGRNSAAARWRTKAQVAPATARPPGTIERAAVQDSQHEEDQRVAGLRAAGGGRSAPSNSGHAVENADVYEASTPVFTRRIPRILGDACVEGGPRTDLAPAR